VRVLFDLTPPDPLPDADAFLIECGRGALPGGNGQPWDWSAAATLIAALPRPCGLAGGLADDNVAHALAVSGAAAADASSSVEDAPGLKNLGAVRRFIAAVHAAPAASPHTVF
jgi:phosphoribosylanthranilate isomerase